MAVENSVGFFCIVAGAVCVCVFACTLGDLPCGVTVHLIKKYEKPPSLPQSFLSISDLAFRSAVLSSPFIPLVLSIRPIVLIL